MDGREQKRLVYSLTREHSLDAEQITETLRILAADLNTLRDTKKHMDQLNDKQKNRLKENVLAAIKKNDDTEQTNSLFMTTFIVAIMFGVFGVLFEQNILGWYFIGIIAFIAIKHVIKNHRQRNPVYVYKLIVYIENLES